MNDELSTRDKDPLEGTLNDDLSSTTIESEPTLNNGSVLGLYAKRHKGPLPDAETLAAYKLVDPELPREVLEMAKREQSHRHEITRQSVDIERSEVAGRIAAVKRGQWAGFAICALIIVLSGVMTLVGYPAIGAALAGINVVGLAWVFVRSGQLKRPDSDYEPMEEDDKE